MVFEYDPRKSASNKEKHGIDFEEAKGLWKDPDALKVPLAYEGEERYLVTGVMGGKHWTAICTDRAAAVRIISVRRAHEKEERLYEDGEI